MVLIKSLKHTTGQLQEFIEALDSDQFSQPLDLFSGATIGQHVRHIVEYFEILSQGIPSGSVCYDNRQREIILETDPEAASDRLQQAVEELVDADLFAPLDLIADFSNSGEQDNELVTTVEREIMYTLEHAIHHMAIIKMGILKDYPEVELPENFGIAYSTIRFRTQS